jgi:hypothetical protein
LAYRDGTIEDITAVANAWIAETNKTISDQRKEETLDASCLRIYRKAPYGAATETSSSAAFKDASDPAHSG